MDKVIIVGQGLAGTWLSWWLHQAGIGFSVIDRPDPGSASKRAAGLINPVTGRRLVKTWLIDELMPFSVNSYREIGQFLMDSFIQQTSVVDFFPTVQMLQAFQNRHHEDPQYLIPGEDREKYAEWFRYDLGWGAIHPCQLVNVEKLLYKWRAWLRENQLLVEEEFDHLQLQQNEHGVTYSGNHARCVIFCDGKSSAQNGYFEKLPFALNKGEGMLVEIKDLPGNRIYKRGMSLVPYGENIFWLGSSYEWLFENEEPTEKFRKNAEDWLKHFLKVPYSVQEHFAALRPATLERRPFVGFHPLYPHIGILNGLGTKGCSLAPYFARELANKIAGTGNVHSLADISRFDRILRRPAG